MIGRVDGNVTTGEEARPLRGLGILVVAMLLGVVFLLIVNAKLIVSGLVLAILAVLPILLVLVLIPLLIGRAIGLGGVAKSVLGSSAGYAVRGGMQGAYRGGQALSGRAATVTVHRFRVRALTGELVPCVLYGDLVGDEVRHGDYVRLGGTRSRDGHLMLTSAQILQGPNGPTVSTVRTRRGVGHHFTVWADRFGLLAGIVLFAVIGIGFVVLLVHR